MNQPMISEGPTHNFLDMLVALSKRWRLLLAGPLVLAFLSLGLLIWLPARYTSEAIILLPSPGPASLSATAWPGFNPVGSTVTAAQAAAVMKSAVVLDPVLKALNPTLGTPDESMRSNLSRDIKAVAAKEGLIRVEVTALSASDAQKIASLLIEKWLETTLPAAHQKEELEARLAHAKQTLATTQKILETQKAGLSSVSGLGDLLDRYFAQTLDVQRQLKGLTRDVVIQAPTLPVRPVAPSYLIVFVQVFAAAELFFLLWVLALHALSAAIRNPQAAHQVHELRASLPWFGRR